MRYVSQQTFNSQFLGNPEYKNRVYYNKNNTVAIFDEGDEDLRKYVWEKGVKLKESGFEMNQESEEILREYFRNNPAGESKEEKTEAVLESKPLFSEEKYSELMSCFESKVTLAQLTTIVQDILQALQER